MTNKSSNIDGMGQALAYLRVSSEEQTLGFSMISQREYCEKTAKQRGLELVKVFEDPGFSATTLKRPGLLNLLEYCRRNQKKITAVIAYKIDRISRETGDFLAVRKQLAGYGVDFISATEPTGNSPTDKFIETIMAAQAQLENALRAERVSAGMKKRFESGYLNGKPPIGYMNALVDNRTMPIPDPETFNKMKEFWDIMATGSKTLKEMAELMNKAGLKSKSQGKKYNLRLQTCGILFRNKFYIGRLTGKYGETEGKHQPMISKDTFLRVQEILDGRRVNNPVIKGLKVNNDFPLRRIIKCGRCGGSFTGSWSKGKNKRFAYYLCSKCRCKSIPVKDLEDSLVERLRTLKPSPELYKKFTLLVNAEYKKRHAFLNKQKTIAQAKVDELEGSLKLAAQKNMKGLYSDEIFVDIRDKINNEILVQKVIAGEETLAIYDIEALLSFFENLINDLGKVWLTSNSGQQRLLLCSIFEEMPSWMYSGLSNTKIKPMFSAFKDESSLEVLSGEA